MFCSQKIKLAPTLEQHHQLLTTMHRFNHACNYISEVAYYNKTYNKIGIQKICYYDVREKFGLSAQMVVRAIGKVAESYKNNKKMLHTFKLNGAMVYDERILSFKGLEVSSILTLDGRIGVPMIISNYQQRFLFETCIRSQADLIQQDGAFYLILVVNRPEPPKIDTSEYLGMI